MVQTMTSGDNTAGAAQVAKRVVIIGGVAGGMSTATRLRRLDAAASITVLERSGHVSFANCGLPYFVGGLIEEEEDLTLQTPEQLFDRFRLDVRVNSEVVAIDPAAHSVTMRSTLGGAETAVSYDKLVLSMGAAPVRPPIPGYERVRTLRTVEDAALLASDVGAAPKTAVVIGAGFIGLEMAENLAAKGLSVTIVEATPQVLPPLDPEMAVLVADELVAHGVTVETGVTVEAVGADTVTLADGRVLPADLVVGAIGVRPDVELASAAGLDLGPSGGLAVNEVNQTSDADIYAVGDAVEKPDAVSHATSLIALANVANRQGRRVADHIAGQGLASGGLTGHRHREGVRPGGGDGGLERAAPTGGWTPVPVDPLPPLRSRHLLPGRDSDGGQAHLRSPRRDHSRSPDRRPQRRRQAHRRHRHRHGGRSLSGRARGPGACLCASVLVGQGSGQHARIHGRECPERRLRHRGPRRARRPDR